MNILFIGDIFAAAGRQIGADHLQDIKESNRIDLAIANAENAAGGFGLTPASAEEMLAIGLDVITLVGALRYQEQRSIPQIHHELQRRGVQIASRTVTDQLYRYEELLALNLADPKRLQERLVKHGQVILAASRVAARCWA